MSAAPTFVRVIRVFVSSPGDVTGHREVLDEVVQVINRTDGQPRGFRLELFRWEEDVAPRIGPQTQGVIDDQTPACDIYLGIMSTRFGTPTGRHGSGTEQEFRDALQQWKQHRSPWITFYFESQPQLSDDPDDVEQYLNVCKFKRELQEQGIIASFAGVRGRAEGFYEKVSSHLRQIVQRLSSQNHEQSMPASTAQGPPILPLDYMQWLQSGCRELELPGLEVKHGSCVQLNHVYTPARRPKPKEERDTHVERGDVRLLHLLKKQSLYVSGDPGSGKSTFCRWVTWLMCHGSMPDLDVTPPDEYREQFPENLVGGLPLLVTLRDFWPYLPATPGVRSLGVQQLETALANWLRDQKAPVLDWNCVDAHLQNGSAVLIFDGVDEVPSIRSVETGEWYPREMLLDALAKGVKRWTEMDNRVLVTSRPYGLNASQQQRLGLLDAPLAGLDRPLEELLIRRWFQRLKENREAAGQAADDLIERLNAEPGLDELAANPLLLTSMCIIYDEAKRLLQDKYELYNRIVDTVLHKRYPPVKELVSVIRGRLAAVALGMHTGDGLGPQRTTPESIASDAEVDLLLQAYRRRDGSTDQGLRDTVQVRENLLSQSGLLVARGDGRASFYHLSFQEFLAAERLFVLLGSEQDGFLELLLQRGPVAGWRNTLSFVFGSLITKFNTHRGVALLEALIGGIELPTKDHRGEDDGVWNLALVLGDCLRILLGRETGIPADLNNFFQRAVTQAIELEIPVKQRQALTVVLGHLGDHRIAPDLRITDAQQHPGYVNIPSGQYVYGDDKQPFMIKETFWLSRFPVTNTQFALFMKDGGYGRKEFWSNEGWEWLRAQQVTEPAYYRDPRFNVPNQPVVGVSFWEAEAFARWTGGALPTERQWEAAARGADGLVYPWGDDFEDGICNSYVAGLRTTSAVGMFPRDRGPTCGAMDMAGNVWEWCSDREGSYRVGRGGGLFYGPGGCRSAYSFRFVPKCRLDSLGFRLARSSVQPSQVSGARSGG